MKMAKVTLLFYRAFDNPHATLLDKLVAWIDGGIHSHVEVVTNNAPWALHTVGCHLMRGGVSAGDYTAEADYCDIVTFDAVDNAHALYLATRGQGYSILAAAATRWHWLPTRGWACNVWAAAACGMDGRRLPIWKLFEIACASKASA